MVDHDKGDEKNDEDRESVKSIVSDTIKKLFTAGVSAAFMTEESIRHYLKEVKLPKDVLSTLLQGANKSKEDLMNVVTNEVVNVIKRIDFVEEASRFVENHKFRISAEIEVVKKESNEPSEIKTNVHMATDPFGKS